MLGSDISLKMTTESEPARPAFQEPSGVVLQYRPQALCWLSPTRILRGSEAITINTECLGI